MAKRITKCHPIGLERFQSIWMNNFEIWNLYVKNIMFVYSLPMSTSTWLSDHYNGPGGYMSGELKSENIKYRKSPYLKKPLSSNKIYNCPITYNQVPERC
jgi:hypothetical protein